MAYSKETYKSRDRTSKIGVFLSSLAGMAFQVWALILISNPSGAKDCYLAIVLSLSGVIFFIMLIAFTILYGINELLGGKENGSRY